MKRLVCCIFCLFLLCGGMTCAVAESTKEYRDTAYSFRYPETWSCDKAGNGDIVLLSPDGKSAVLTFALRSDLWPFSGDALTDAPMIESYIASYGGKNLSLTGEYELAASNGMRGFRAFGSWLATGDDAVMLVLSDDSHLVGFVLVGEQAIALEQELLDSGQLTGDGPEESGEGFLRWEGESISMDYPDGYGMQEQSSGVAFFNMADPNQFILARIYPLDFDYDDKLAADMAAMALPKSANVEPNAEMVQIGSWNAGVVYGTVSEAPMAFYMIGSGRTAVGIMFMGEGAASVAEQVIQSVEIK